MGCMPESVALEPDAMDKDEAVQPFPVISFNIPCLLFSRVCDLISHGTLVGRQDARTLLYNIKSSVEGLHG